MDIKDIKIRDGKITTIFGERRCGMTTLLCSHIGKALEDGKRVLLVSYMMNCAMECKKRLIDMYNNSLSYDKLDVISVSSLEDRLMGNRYDLVVFDTPHIFHTDWDHIMVVLRGCGSPCVIGITWEGIDSNEEVLNTLKKVKKLSDYSYRVIYSDAESGISIEMVKDVDKELSFARCNSFILGLDKISEIPEYFVNGIKFLGNDHFEVRIKHIFGYSIQEMVNSFKNYEDLELSYLDAYGSVIERWVYKRVELVDYEIGDLDYSNDEGHEFKILIRFGKMECIVNG